MTAAEQAAKGTKQAAIPKHTYTSIQARQLTDNTNSLTAVTDRILAITEDIATIQEEMAGIQDATSSVKLDSAIKMALLTIKQPRKESQQSQQSKPDSKRLKSDTQQPETKVKKETQEDRLLSDDEEAYSEPTEQTQPKPQWQQQARPKAAATSIKQLKLLIDRRDIEFIENQLNKLIEPWVKKGEQERATKVRNAAFYLVVAGKMSFENFKAQVNIHGGSCNLYKAQKEACEALEQNNHDQKLRILNEGYTV